MLVLKFKPLLVQELFLDILQCCPPDYIVVLSNNQLELQKFTEGIDPKVRVLYDIFTKVQSEFLLLSEKLQHE